MKLHIQRFERGMQPWVRWGCTYGVVDEVRYDGLHQLLVPPVADQSDQHLKQLAYQALKVHVVPLLVCLHTQNPF